MTEPNPRPPRRGAAGVAAALALALAGCVPTEDVVLPALPEGGSALLVYAEAGRPVAIYAIDGARARPEAVALGPRSEVYLVLYDCPLGQLGLEPGWRAAADDGHAQLPEPAAVRRLIRDRPPRWAPLSVPPAWLVQPPASDCSTLRGTHVPLDGAAGMTVSLLLALDADRVLVALRGDDLPDAAWIVTSTSARPLALPTGTSIRGGWRTRSGELRLVSAAGEILRWTETGAFVPTVYVPRTRARNRLERVWAREAGPEAAPELFVLTSAGTLDRWDGATWTRLLDLDVCPAERACDSGALLVRPDQEVLSALQPAGGRLYRVRSGTVSAEPFSPAGDPASATALAEGAPWGLVAGTSGAGLYLRGSDDLWAALDVGEAARVNGLVLDGDRLYCACGPLLTEYRFGKEKCADEALPVYTDFRHLVALERRTPDAPLRLAVMSGAPDRPADVTFVEVERPAPRACPAPRGY